MEVGNEVSVLEPFDGQDIVFLEGVEAAFSPAYLEVVSP